MTRSHPISSLYVSTNSHAAFSARALLALYISSGGASFPCCSTMAGDEVFQSVSVKVYASGPGLTMLDVELVMTTRLTEELRDGKREWEGKESRRKRRTRF